MRPLLSYFAAVFKHWWFVVSSAIFTGLGLYAMELGKSNEWYVKVSFVLAGIAFFVATYLAWKEQHNRAAGNTPDFVLEVPSVFAHSEGGKTLILLSLRIINRGAPSAVIGYKVRYMAPDLEQDGQLIYTKKLNQDNEPLDAPLVFNMKDGGVLSFRGSDAIYTQTDPIPAGGLRSGRLPVSVDGNRVRDITVGRASLIVTIVDYRGRESTTTFTGTGDKPLSFMLGEPIDPGSRTLIVGALSNPSKSQPPASRRKKNRRKH